MNTNTERIRKLSCVITIKANGVMVPKECKALDGTLDVAAIENSDASVALVVRPTCEATWNTAGLAEITLKIGSTVRRLDVCSLPFSKSGALLGYGTFNDRGIVTIEAVKRSQ
jgi:hypothetical protein